MPSTAIARRDTLRFGLLGLAALPFAAPFARPARAAEADAAAAPVEALNAALLAVMKAGPNVPFARRYDMLAPAVSRAFDLDAILRVSVGPHWSAMAPEQQATLSAAFRQYTVANFVANFDSYGGQPIELSPETRALANGDQVVTTRIGGDFPVVLSYVMRQTASGWKAVDVLADGSISRVATQRSDFRNLLSSGGGPALVASLQSKVAALSGGSPAA